MIQKTSKFIVALLVGAFLFSCLSESSFAQDRRLRLDFKQDRLSADIRNAALRAVIDEIKRKKSIKFATWDTSLDEEISVRFKNLSIEDGLKRILAGMNHSLMFIGDRVVKVMLFGKQDKRAYRYRRRRTLPRRTRRRR